MPPSLPSSSILSSYSSSSSCTKQLCRTAVQSSRSFSSTPQHNIRITRNRSRFWRWIHGPGENFKNALPGSTNYLNAYDKKGQLKRVTLAQADKARDRAAAGEQEPEPSEDPEGKKKEALPPEKASDMIPFPLNKTFMSETVLNDEFREELWSQVMQNGKSVREVSTQFRVEMSRVGAVVRLMEIEKEWKRIGKPLARPYAQAVMAMLPKTPFTKEPKSEGAHFAVHEAINNLPVHSATGQQIFHPTSESRHFTRVDAAKIFSKNLLPADDRIPHPELVIQHREKQNPEFSPEDLLERATIRRQEADELRTRKANRLAKAEARVQKVESSRWQFRITPINVDAARKDGKGPNATGWRYGVPLYDRSRGQHKIPKTAG